MANAELSLHIFKLPMTEQAINGEPYFHCHPARSCSECQVCPGEVKTNVHQVTLKEEVSAYLKAHPRVDRAVNTLAPVWRKRRAASSGFRMHYAPGTLIWIGEMSAFHDNPAAIAVGLAGLTFNSFMCQITEIGERWDDRHRSKQLEGAVPDELLFANLADQEILATSWKPLLKHLYQAIPSAITTRLR